MNRATVRLLCPAKVNLALSVGGVDNDGYHDICSWMVAVSLYDELIVERLEDGELEGEFDVGWCDDAMGRGGKRKMVELEGKLEGEWAIEDDIVYRIHRAMEERVGRKLNVDVRVRKRIPAGAGLGGGSSDGAGMIKALNELFELGMSRNEMVDVAMEVGSDLVFFFGSGSSVVSGRGEKVRDVKVKGDIDLVLVVPRFGCSTGEVYGAFDEIVDEDRNVDKERVEKAVGAWPICDDVLFNDLAEAACKMNSKLGELRTKCAEISGRVVHVTGSGSGMFVVARDGEDAGYVAERLREVAVVSILVVSAAGRGGTV